MTASTDRSRSEVVLVDEDEHLGLLADFIRKVWSPHLEVEALRVARAGAARTNPAEPGCPPPTFLFLLDGEPVGHLTTIPMQLQYGEWRGPAHWLKGFWVLPEHRNGPIGAMLVRAAARHLDCLLATVVDDAPRRVFGAFKMQDLGEFSEHIRVLRPGRVLGKLDLDALGLGTNPALRGVLAIAGLPGVSHLAGVVARAALAARSALSHGTRDGDVRLDSPAAAGLDGLWETIAAEGTCSPVRDAAYRRRLYEESRSGVYRLLTLERNGAPVGWASIRVPPEKSADARLRGIRIATLSDVVVPTGQAGDALALLREAESVARDLAADALLCSATHPRLREWLAERAFVSTGGNLHLTARGPKAGPALPRSINDWWLTRADGGADDGL